VSRATTRAFAGNTVVAGILRGETGPRGDRERLRGEGGQRKREKASINRLLSGSTGGGTGARKEREGRIWKGGGEFNKREVHVWIAELYLLKRRETEQKSEEEEETAEWAWILDASVIAARHGHGYRHHREAPLSELLPY